MTFNTDFTFDVKALLTRQKNANLGPYLYSTPQPEIKDDPVCGEHFYQKLVYEVDDYYLYQDEIRLIQKIAPKLAGYVSPDTTVIEFGVGTEQAFINKTLPLLKAIPQLNKYVPVDLCDKYLQESQAIIAKIFPTTSVQTIQTDFIKNCDVVGQFPQPVVFFKGSTITNLSQAECIIFLKRLADALRPHGILMVGEDSNQNEKSLKLAYDNQMLAKMILNIFYRIQRDCPVKDFNPTAFDYRFEWHTADYCVKHNAIATESQNFKFQDQIIDIQQDDVFQIVSSYKYPVKVFQRMATESGFKILEHFVEDNQRMVIHVLKAE